MSATILKQKPSFLLLPQVCGYGYYSYSPSSSQFGTRETIDTILFIAKYWYRNQTGEIGIGDMSFRNGAVMKPHKSHINGKCIDIRPIRRDRKPAPVTIHDSEYDRDATRWLIDCFLCHVNTAKILFNDPEIKGVKNFKGHDNHIHVQTAS